MNRGLLLTTLLLIGACRSVEHGPERVRVEYEWLAPNVALRVRLEAVEPTDPIVSFSVRVDRDKNGDGVMQPDECVAHASGDSEPPTTSVESPLLLYGGEGALRLTWEAKTRSGEASGVIDLSAQ